MYLNLQPFSRRETTEKTDQTPFLRTFFEKQALPRTPRVSPIAPGEMVSGGMPPVCLGEAEDLSVWFQGFEQTYIERDLRSLAQVGDLVAFRNFMKLTALRSGQILNVSGIARDAKLSATTATRYLGLLETSFVISRLTPYRGNRASRLVKSPKVFVADSGLAAHLAGVASLEPRADEPLRGPLFETFVAVNLASILSAHWPEAALFYWNVQSRHEVDFVIEAGRDSLAMEIKAASRWDERDLRGLEAFLSATPRCRAAVLTHNGTGAARLGDRLWAIPAGLLLS